MKYLITDKNGRKMLETTHLKLALSFNKLCEKCGYETEFLLKPITKEKDHE